MDPAARRTTPGKTRRLLACAPCLRASRRLLALLALALTLPARARPASDVYMGRTIAPAMGFGGADWLDRAEQGAHRGARQGPGRAHPREGMTVADIGAGTGYFAMRLAGRVGPQGHVIATDIDMRRLEVLTDRADRRSLSNIETRLATGARLGSRQSEAGVRRAGPCRAYSATTPSTCSPRADRRASTRFLHASASTPAGAFRCTSPGRGPTRPRPRPRPSPLPRARA